MNYQNKENDAAIVIKNLGKKYRLGTIGGGTLYSDLNRWWARVRGKEDPYSVVGQGNTFDDYGKEFWALRDINLTIKKGETIGIIGHNGAGKSTLLKVLSRVTAPTTGEAFLYGRVSSMLEVGTGFHPELTGRENIYMNGAILGMTKKEVDSKIEDIIDFSECRQFIDTPVKRYSSGMYVKLAFSVSAFLDADIMIMDEVLAVGDVKFQQKCLGKMDGAARQEGKTVLYVSHNMSTIRQLCSRCIVLDHGRIAYDGDVEEAIKRYIGLEGSDLKRFINFENSKRPESFGLAIKLLDMEFVGKEMASFLDDEDIHIRMHYKAGLDLNDLYLRFEVQNMDSSPVGMAESNRIAHVKKDEEGYFDMHWSVANFAPGRYQMVVDINTKNEFGSYHSYDHPYTNVFFEVDQDITSGKNKSAWDRRAWNSIRLNQIEISSTEDL